MKLNQFHNSLLYINTGGRFPLELPPYAPTKNGRVSLLKNYL